ncbi:hypothetical protein DM872_09620 [Pseudomonas taiwanensis]|uniref:hypothetical protein n=1 Tax=Pseudomonas taiwanensis TaxID=470150 RepID=UPI0015B8B739|nr:hypothetical protein [Pseudomonas taiwanensis]NWL77110.1 hypothetical protein [Pseudomonas taiwanensis]
MDEILKDFLIEGEKILQVQPFDFFPDPSEAEGNDGILALYFVIWSASRHILMNGGDVLQAAQVSSDFSGKMRAIRDLLGETLLPSIYTEIGNKFTQQYYRPGGKHFYLADFAATFPDCERFEDVPDSEVNYKVIVSILDERFNEWKSSL